QPIPDEEKIGIKEEDKYVLGVKTEFLRRGSATITVKPARPIGIAGIVKTMSVWVAGRNYNHTLKVLLQDFSGNPFELTMGKLNFSGWKQLIVAIPPNVEQRNPHYSTQTGIKFLGFSIECDMRETYGNYYVYFDDLRAVTDLFAEENRDIDDMLDAW
ncbi:MAG: flagellar filament outer layer protein FlaA, partial [Spirochaetales bacterium]